MSNDTQLPLSTADRPTLSSASDPIRAELQRYDAHLRDVHGLALDTRRTYLRIAGRLLRQRFDGDHVDIATLQPSDIRRFLACELSAHRTSAHARSVTSGLRSYLRYRSTQGDPVEPLTGVIASPAHWTLAPLPKALSREEAARLLDACQAVQRWPKRGYAMARCALDLGLRAGEIAHLMIGDIDWQAGTVTLRATKSRRQDVLPLPVETGEALADYLMYERPGSAGAAVFVRALKPYDRPVTSTAVQKVITRALRRSGLPYSGSHVLRHTFAADLLERGSSLKEIADLLRHRSLQTTQIYAKLDTPHLIGVALPLAGECVMSAPIPLQQRVDDYLAERRQLGFELQAIGGLLGDFATFVSERHHDGPLSVELMVEWTRQAKRGQGTRETWYRRLANLRPFLRYLRQFEPDTEIPEETLFGPAPGRVAPHIYREEEIVALLVATRSLGPPGCLRAATYETLFGLMAATGLRVSEAIRLRDADVDLKRGLLTVRESKFGKSRQVPLHPSTVEALTRFRKRRRREIPTTPDPAFFTGSRGSLPGQPLGDRQVHRVFDQLRAQLHWANRGAHAAPRLHDLRHTFAVRRLIEWQREGSDLDRKMLALSTYLGHTEIRCTYWYLSAVPELMAVAGAKFERFAALGEYRDA